MSPSDITSYRARVIQRHREAFNIHTTTAVAIERALLIPRRHRTAVHYAIDMFMLQSCKTHSAVSLLAQHGLMEDTATGARRLLELSVQAVYVGAPYPRSERQRRAGRYLAHMWREVPSRTKRGLPASVREYWSGIARQYGRFVRRGAHSWGPGWKAMFSEIGQLPLYELDYSLLSGIAHGRSTEQIINFSRTAIRLQSDQFVSVLLVYSTKYYLVVAEQWNKLYRRISRDSFDALVSAATIWRLTRTTPLGAA